MNRGITQSHITWSPNPAKCSLFVKLVISGKEGALKAVDPSLFCPREAVLSPLRVCAEPRPGVSGCRGISSGNPWEKDGYDPPNTGKRGINGFNKENQALFSE